MFDPGTEPIIIIEDWYKEQTICGEEYVHVCCSQFNQTEPECKSYDVKNLCKVKMMKYKPSSLLIKISRITLRFMEV